MGSGQQPRNQVWTSPSALGVPFWAALGETSRIDVEEESPILGQCLLWVYVVASQVVLVNLLIAMMSNTYQKHALNAEKEYFFNRVSIAVESTALFAVPPPLSLLILLCSPHLWQRHHLHWREEESLYRQQPLVGYEHRDDDDELAMRKEVSELMRGASRVPSLHLARTAFIPDPQTHT